MTSASQQTAPTQQHENLWELLAKNNFPQEVTGLVQKHVNGDEDMARKRQKQWQYWFDLKMGVLAKKLHEIEHTVAMLESPQLSADMRALILKPNVTPRTFAEKAFKTLMTDLFLRKIHVSVKCARRLRSAWDVGNAYVEKDESGVLRDRWVAGELPSVKTIVERFWIMRHFDPLTNYLNRCVYVQDVSLALWYAKKIYSYHDPDLNSDVKMPQSDVKMLQLSIHNLERLIHKEYDEWDYRQTQMLAMQRYHDIIEQCKTKRDRENARFRYTDKEGNVQEVEIGDWNSCKEPGERTCDSEPDEGIDDDDEDDEDYEGD